MKRGKQGIFSKKTSTPGDDSSDIHLFCFIILIMGKIEIENMEFYAYHGHYREEQIVGNKFLVNLTIDSDLELPAKSDSLKDAVNYQRAYEIVEQQMTINSKLLENIAGRIIAALYKEFKGIRQITVKVSKINPPVGGKVDRISVTMTR